MKTMEVIDEDFITYSEQSHSITLLSKKDKKSLNNSILDDLQRSVIDYTTNKYENQNSYLFEFLLSLNKKQFSEKIQKLVSDIIAQNKSSKLNSKGILLINNADEFNLTYSNLCAIVNFIIELSEYEKSNPLMSDILYNFAYEMKEPTIHVSIYNQTLSKILNDFISIKKINICLSKDFEDMEEEQQISKCQIDVNVVRLFSFFLKSFFPSVTNAIVDLNIYPINNIFNNNQNPYKIKENNILKLCNLFSGLLISNLIMMGNLTKLQLLINLNIKMLDSYQIETHYMLTNLLSKNNENKTDKNIINKINTLDMNDNEDIFTNSGLFNNSSNNNLKFNRYSSKFNNNLLFFQHIISKSESDYREFKFEINSLDPLLFKYINILLVRYKCLRNVTLTFFPEKIANKRKTAINNYYYNLYSNKKKEDNYCDNDKKVYYRFLNNLIDNENEKDSDYLLVKNENILNDLFFSFNRNLNILSLILEEKLPHLVTISLNFCVSYNDNLNISNFDTYNSAIICFLINLFKSLEYASKSKIKNMLNLIEIYCDEILDENIFLIESVKNKYIKGSGVFDLRGLKISNLKFSIPNITLLVSLDYFPFEKLQELILMNVSYNDLVNLSEKLSKNKKLFPRLVNFEISLNYMVEDYKPPLKLLLKDCIANPNFFTLTIPFNLSFEEMVEIFSWIKRNKNKKPLFHLKLSNSELSPCVGQSSFIHNVEYFYESVKPILIKNNIICQFKTVNYNKFNVYFKILDIKSINVYLAFIHCFNIKKNTINLDKKVEEEWNKNCNEIFENTFYYKGKFKEKMILVEIA